jgi:CheY-like chemotaxis protein
MTSRMFSPWARPCLKRIVLKPSGRPQWRGGAGELVRRGLEDGQRVTVAILDLTMPGGASGFEVLEWLRACDPELPVIACSGYFQEDVRELCQAIGFIDVLHKPFNLETLGVSVRRAMAQGNEAAAFEATLNHDAAS